MTLKTKCPIPALAHKVNMSLLLPTSPTSAPSLRHAPAMVASHCSSNILNLSQVQGFALALLSVWDDPPLQLLTFTSFRSHGLSLELPLPILPLSNGTLSYYLPYQSIQWLISCVHGAPIYLVKHYSGSNGQDGSLWCDKSVLRLNHGNSCIAV